LSGSDNIYNEAHDVASNIPIIFFRKILNLYAASININPFSDAETIFGQRGYSKYKIIKFYFAPKLPSICINQKCSNEVGSLHILYSLKLNDGLGASPQRLTTLLVLCPWARHLTGLPLPLSG